MKRGNGMGLEGHETDRDMRHAGNGIWVNEEAEKQWWEEERLFIANFIRQEIEKGNIKPVEDAQHTDTN